MSSGRDLLRSIDRALAQSQTAFREIDADVRSLSARLAAARQREAAIYRELAAERLERLEAGELLGNLDAAERRAAELLERRDRERRELEAEIERVDSYLADIEAQRETAARRLAAEEERLEQLLERVQAELDGDEAYGAAAAAAQSAVDTTAAAEDKTAEAEARRAEKGAPYEADRLFMYLWERGYGTSRYRAWPLARLVDGIVARHIGFPKARRNYYLLNEIPRRLAAHTDRLRAEAERRLESVAGIERDREIAAGAEALEAAIADTAQELDRIDADIAGAERDLAELVAQREPYVAGEDATFVEALGLLADGLRADPLPRLRAEAQTTPASGDDRLVEELDTVVDDQARLSDYMADQRGLHARHRERVNDLTRIRRRYKEKRFDSGASVIDDRGNVELMLAEFLRGVIDADGLWRTIRHAQRFRQTMRASSRHRGGGLRVPRMPRGVRLPRGMGGGGGFRMPRMPGGGFRTKGGF